MLAVVADACSLQPDRTRGIIVIESDLTGPPYTAAFHELDGQEPIQMALTVANQMGVVAANLNGNRIGPYPVNAAGQSLDMVKDDSGQPLPQTHERMKPWRYRVDIPVTRPLR